MDEYPIYDDEGVEELGFMNKWRGDQNQTIDNVCEANNAHVVLSPLTNLVTLRLTEQEIVEILSSLYAGAEFAYPEKYLQIVYNFLRGIQCPPILEEQDCFEYPTYASFIAYSPANPYVDPDLIPDGYLFQPFLINGENGVDIPNYEHFDILVPFASITLDVNWFDDISGQLPTILITVQGEGQVFLKFLNQVQGGLVVVTVDNPPDLLDIIGGIVTGGDNIMDLNLDIVSLPPETAIEIDYTVNVTGTGVHTIYIVFLPILDDSLIPLRFGGGFRGVQLCGFVEQPEMGIQSIRFDETTCELQTLVDGDWVIVPGWANWLDCVPSGGGGGGGGLGSIEPQVVAIDLSTNKTTTSTTYVQMAGSNIAIAPLKDNVLFVYDNVLISNSGANLVSLELRYNGVVGFNSAESRLSGQGQQTLAITSVFTGMLAAGSHDLSLYWKTAAGTATADARSKPVVTALWFDDIEELFVQDIRIVDEELQKKIGGVWITVDTSLKTLFDAVQAAAAAAQTTANGAVSVNTSQQTQINSIITVNNNQNTRLNALEAFQTDAELSFLGVQAQLDNHEARIDALEAGGANSVWSETIDFQASTAGWSTLNFNTWSGGDGWILQSGQDLQIANSSLAFFDQRITHVKLRFSRVQSFSGLHDVQVSFPLDATTANARLSGAGFTENWYKVPNRQLAQNFSLLVSGLDTSFAYLESITLLGQGQNLW